MTLQTPLVLRVEDLRVQYGELKVVHGVSLVVGTAETVCLLGPNGAGKSTVVNAISGLLPSALGEVWLLNERIDNLPTHERVERGLAHVLERHHVFPYMTVFENLEIGGYSRRASRRRQSQLPMVYELFPRLAERKAQLAGTLSGGEQQMLATARGLMSAPRLLILDEPFIGLAPSMVGTMIDAIRKVNEMGISVLFIEQNVAQALSSSARGYILETGRVALEGDARELLNDPRVKQVYLGM